MRLLLAEDEKALSKALTAILERNNYSVDAVYDGQSALEYLETDNYDGVILDIMMPKVDGLTVLRKVRERCSRSHKWNLCDHQCESRTFFWRCAS